MSEDNNSRSQSEEGKQVLNSLEVEQSSAMNSSLEFKVWDAENLEGLSAPESIDAIINVEASHQYGSREDFFQGVH